MDVIAAAGLIPDFINSLKGPDKARQAVTRKDEIYIPLSEALVKYTDESFPLFENIEIPFLIEIVEKNYKYGLSDDLAQECKALYEYCISYNRIDLRIVVIECLWKSFEYAYESIFGSCVEGVSCVETADGEVINSEIPAQAIEIMHTIRVEDDRIIQLLKSNANASTYIDFDNEIFVDQILLGIFDWALHGIDPNGYDVVLPKPIKPLIYTIPEQMTLECHFWEKYNMDQRVLEKKSMHDEIMYRAQIINQHCKDIIEYTVKKFESTKADNR